MRQQAADEFAPHGIVQAEASPPVTDDLTADLRAWFSLADTLDSVEVARALIAVTATDPQLGAALNDKLAAPVREWVTRRLTIAMEAGHVRPDVDAAVVAEQFVAMTAYAALLGRPLGPDGVDAVVDIIIRGIGA